MSVSAHSPTLPDPLDGIELREPLGHGASSTVHRGERGSVRLAVKVMRDRPGSDRTETAYAREAALLGNLRHPGLARIYAVGMLEGRPALVMELIEGGTLQSVLAARGGPLSEPDLLTIAIDLVGALGAAHAAGVVHRDVKPANVLVQPDGHAKLIDFGLATRAGTQQSRDATIGTVRYSPPEQTGLLARPIDGRSDLYSVGALLFEAATGRPPFDDPDVGELARQHAVAEPADPRALNPALSPGLAALILRLLAKDPDDRYQTAHGVVRDLGHLARDGGNALSLGADDDPELAGEATALIGRSQELAALRERWARAERGHGSVVAIHGTSGSGRGRLVREVAAEARRTGALDLVVRATATGDAPLSAFQRCVERHLDQVDGLADGPRARAVAHLRAAVHAGGVPVARLSPRLAAFGDAQAHAAPVSSEQRAASIATFLATLARHHGSALMRIRDAHRLDEASLQVLRQLMLDITDAPLLVAATVDPEACTDEVTATFSGAPTISVGPLQEPDSGALISALLGGLPVQDELVEQLHRRSGGSPFALHEYVSAITHAGLVRPSWGTLVVDYTGLDALHLPDDVLDLVLQRASQLSAGARALLRAAAVAGLQFEGDIAAQAAHLSDDAEAAVVGEALAARLIERRDQSTYGFVHERVREALLADLGADAQRDLHQRIADVIEQRTAGTATPEETLQLAEHLEAGHHEGTAARRAHWHAAAGQTALQTLAFRVAAQHFAAADHALAEQDVFAGADLHEGWGHALVGLGQVPESTPHFDQVLALSRDPHQRARVLLTRSQILFSAYDALASLACAERGLHELGWHPSRGRLGRTMQVLVAGIVGLLMLGTRRGVGRARPEEHPTLALQVNLLRIAAQARYLLLQPLGVAAYTVIALPRAARLGPSRELVQVMSSWAVIASSFGARRLRTRLVEGAQRLGEHIGDPGAIAFAHMHDLLSLDAAGRQRDAGEIARTILPEHGRWLDTSDLMLLAGAASWNLDLRGHTREAAQQWQSVYDRVLLASDAGAAENPYVLMGWITLETLGQRAEAAKLRGQVDALGAANADNRYRRQAYLGALTRYLRDQGEYGPELRSAVAALDELKLNPITLNVWAQSAITQPLDVAVEFAERTEDPAERAAFLAEARRRGKVVRRMRPIPILRAMAHVAEARADVLEGKLSSAERRLARAEQLAIAQDMPRIHSDVARVRAFLARERGDAVEVRRQAQLAMRVAIEQGWRGHQERLYREFGTDAGAAPGTNSASGAGPSGSSTGMHIAADASASQTMLPGGSLRSRRTLDALLAMSLAAAHTNDPDELARISLDHVVRLLGAERAFLFLSDDETHEPHLRVARDHEGNDIPATDATYSRAMVDRVARTRQPLLITGDEDAAAIGSDSAERYGLRSMLASPLMIEGRLLGVIAVDSRLARGIFGSGDSDILSAIGSHIAIAQETARAGALELTVAAEREQRGLAEALRDAMVEISATLDPVEVFDRTLTRAWPLIHYDRAAVLLRESDGAWTVPTVAGDLQIAQVRAALARDADEPFLAQLTAQSEPQVMRRVLIGGTPAERLFGQAGSWLSVPLVARGELIGVMVMATEEPEHLGPAQLDVAATFAAQGVIAHENARLFQAVEEMATTDELSQSNNRRHFFALGDTQFATARRYRLPLATLMLDIDHFKAINDRYGHAAGDDVIREVAVRLQAGIREVDILGRYGGEEFAMVLPCTGEDAAILADRLRAAIGDSPILTSAGAISVTASIGVAVAELSDEHLAATLNRADEALYAAKHGGRNCVRVADAPGSHSAAA